MSKYEKRERFNRTITIKNFCDFEHVKQQMNRQDIKVNRVIVDIADLKEFLNYLLD